MIFLHRRRYGHGDDCRAGAGDTRAVNVLITTANDRDELYSALREIAISVPGRASGRTNRHMERWSICRLISSLAHAGKIAFPATVRYSAPPAPDFIAVLGNVLIGVEMTEATSECYSEFRTFVDRTQDFSLIEPAAFRPGVWRRARTRKQRLEAMDAEARKSQLRAMPWLGEEAEYEWGNYVIEAVEKKIPKFPGYLKNCEKLWLSVYVNAPLPSINCNDAAMLLLPKLETLWHTFPALEALFIEDNSKIICLRPDGWTTIPIHNLWTTEGPDAAGAESAIEARNTPRNGTLADFLLNSPLRNSRIVIERDHCEMREIDFGLDSDEEENGKE